MPKISQELLEVLEKVKSASSVALALYEIGTQDVSPDIIERDESGRPVVDYLSISSEDPTKISYLTQDRIDRIKAGTFGPVDDILWTSSRRYHGRPGVVVSKILKSVTMKDLEVFANVFKAAASVVTFDFKVVSGESIRHWYHEGSYARNVGGSLYASCMKHSVCQDFLDLYVQNDDVISMLVMVDKNNMLLGRALLWEFDDIAGSGKVKLMDRIYSANDEDLPYHFKMWAQENGYLFKPVQKWNNSLDFVENGQTVKKRFSLKLNNFQYEKYPYLDTFKFLNTRSGIVSNFLTPGCTMTLCCADGSHHGSDWLREDFIDGTYHHYSEMSSITYNSDSIVGGPIRYTHGSNVRYSEINETCILKTDGMHDPILSDFLFAGELSHLNNMKRMMELTKMRAKVDFGTFLNLACKNMTFAQVMARHSDLRSTWSEDPTAVDRAVSDYFS
jgi:hypothetical protein